MCPEINPAVILEQLSITFGVTAQSVLPGGHCGGAQAGEQFAS